MLSGSCIIIILLRTTWSTTRPRKGLSLLAQTTKKIWLRTILQRVLFTSFRAAAYGKTFLICIVWS